MLGLARRRAAAAAAAASATGTPTAATGASASACARARARVASASLQPVSSVSSAPSCGSAAAARAAAAPRLASPGMLLPRAVQPFTHFCRGFASSPPAAFREADSDADADSVPHHAEPPPGSRMSVAEAEAEVRASAAAAARDLRERLGKDRPVVAVGISGGVDSALAALLLKNEGLDVRGVFLKNWDEAEESADGRACSYEADRADARLVAKAVGISLEEVDFVKEYWNNVFSPFVDAAAAGATPNPDLDCNKFIKFGAFLRWAEAHGADAIATGHYSRIAPAGDGSRYPRLVRGLDHTKDQSYFLASVPGDALQRCCFPLGAARKAAVRVAAAAAALPSAGRRSSAGICFIGRRSFDEFLSGYVRLTPGRFRSVEAPERPFGSHEGVELFTHGQRARIGGAEVPWFVVGKEQSSGTVWVAPGKDHPAIFTSSAVADRLFWVDGHPPAGLLADSPSFSITGGGGGLDVLYKARYGQPSARARAWLVSPQEAAEMAPPSVFCGNAPLQQPHQPPPAAAAPPAVGDAGGGVLLLRFPEPARAITPGQAVVLYSGDVCLGGGVLVHSGRTCFEEEENSTTGHRR